MVLITVRLPVTCPICRVETMQEFPVAVVIVALRRWNQMRLYTKCHPEGWSASKGDLQRIRTHLSTERQR